MPIPALRGLIRRNDLTDRLTRALDKPLVVIQAPPGYGKSAAAAVALSESSTAVAWYQCEAWHVGDFFSPLVAVVRETTGDPDAARLVSSMGSQRPETAEQVDPWAQRIGAEFARELSNRAPLIVVLDDIQLLAEDPALKGFIIGALRADRANPYFWLIGRALPDIGVARWLAGDKAAVFSTEDLVFAPADASELARKRGETIDDKNAALLCDVCEGWPAGIALSLTSGARPTPSSDGRLTAISAYLLEQNINRLPEPFVAFLEQTCALENLPVHALERTGRIAEATLLVKDLEKRGVMVDAVVPGSVYRVHPLLRDALARRLEADKGADALVERQRWAGDFLLATHEVVAALHQFALAHATDSIADVLRMHGESLIAAGRRDLVATLVADLRTADGSFGALCGLLDGIIARQRGDARASGLFEAALKNATGSHDRALTLRLRQLIMQDELSTHARADGRAIAKLLTDTQGFGGAIEAFSLILAGWVRAIHFDFTGARDFAERALDVLGPTADIRQRVDASMLLAYARTALGDFAGAEDLIGSTLGALERSDHGVVRSYFLAWAARMALLRGDVAAAADYSAAAVRLGVHFDLPTELASAYACLAEAALNAGDFDRCAEAVAAVRRLADRAWYGVDRDRLASATVVLDNRVAFLRGDPVSALAEAGKHREPAMTPVQRAALCADTALYSCLAGAVDPSPVIDADRAIAAAVIVDGADASALALGRAELALVRGIRLMDRAADDTKDTHFDAMLAGRHDLGALAASAEALRVIASEPVRELNVTLTLMARTLSKLCGRGPRFEAIVILAMLASLARGRPSIAGKLKSDDFSELRARFPATLGALAEFDQVAEISGPPSPSVDTHGLTPREIEVAALLTEGLTNREMADKLTLSVRTVETHVDRILGKLGVSSRTRAASMISRLGLT
ncbi:MAG TPA: LuxR C-terminal-related transcriptional regulator [Candidatus Eremiobacteraceae bacterium]|nr:LuxR C-terminal-related transcriptional regulator [Candidatus Eremiobacteraceae bacterium]